jgi:hypothetical protein
MGRRWVILGVLGSSLLGCRLITEELPTPTSPTSAEGAENPVRIVVGPAPLPAPTPATPAPAPNPTPEPGPAPPPPSAPSGSCSVGRGSGDGADCPRTSPVFLGDVDRAIDVLVSQRPDLFDTRDQRGAGGYAVRDEGEYHLGVVAILQSRGLCATFDGEEIAVKRTNDFSEQYDIILSDGHVRRGEGMYRATCRPAWF